MSLRVISPYFVGRRAGPASGVVASRDFVSCWMNSGFRFRGMGRANGQVIGTGRPELGVSVKALCCVRSAPRAERRVLFVAHWSRRWS